MAFLAFIALLARFAVDLLIVVLLYDFFAQPFRFYGMDPLTQFIWKAARKVCLPFDAISRRIVRLPDRDLTPLFVLTILVFCRGLFYALAALKGGANLAIVAAGVSLSFQELFTRTLIPGLLFIVYADIQLSRQQETFVGNVFVMIIHDVAKRFVVIIRKLLLSYKPIAVFFSVFFILAVAHWVVTVLSLLPFGDMGVFKSFPRDLLPRTLGWVDQPWLLFPVILFQFAETFLYGIFILILMSMLAGFSGLDPYDRFSMILGLVISPWLIVSRRLFPWARVGMFDFSIALLLLIIYFVLGVARGLVF